jgi:hypothetical protein
MQEALRGAMSIPLPTPQEFLDASNAVYEEELTQNFLDTPSDLIPLEGDLVGSVPIPLGGETDLQSFEEPSIGFFAQAYEDVAGNVIISFDASILPLMPGWTSTYGHASQADDIDLLLGQRPSSLFSQAEKFAQQVVEDYGASHPIYLTGFSLGGAEAEAVASSAPSGVIDGGDTFGAPGLPDYFGTGGDLIDFVDPGDPVGNYARDGARQIVTCGRDVHAARGAA